MGEFKLKINIFARYNNLIHFYFIFFLSMITGEAVPDLPPLTACHLLCLRGAVECPLASMSCKIVIFQYWNFLFFYYSSKQLHGNIYKGLQIIVPVCVCECVLRVWNTANKWQNIKRLIPISLQRAWNLTSQKVRLRKKKLNFNMVNMIQLENNDTYIGI